MYLLEAREVTKNYAGHLALDKVSVGVRRGTVYGLLGPNGAGKTSLIRIINQITGADEGEILFDGKRIKREDISRIGYLPEERGLYKKMKVGEQVLYLAQLKGMSKRFAMRKVKYWFEKFEIESWWNKKVEELSKGMQQKIQFVITILHEPELLVFDEPFTGFDPINTNLLKNEILNLKSNGTTIILSTHNMASVEELCDSIALINKSKKILDGSVNDIKNQFKTNIYKVEIVPKIIEENNLRSFIDKRYEIVSEEKHGESVELVIKTPANHETNELLSSLLDKFNIRAFNEIFPSMNDIFIKKVSEINAAGV